MRARCIPLWLTAFLLIAGPAGARTRLHCGPRSATTLAHSAHMRVYSVDADITTSYRACLYSTHQVTRLAEYDDDEGAHFSDFAYMFRIAGRYVAFAHVSSFEDENGFDLHVFDARRRAEARPGSSLTRGVPLDIVLTTRGGAGVVSASSGEDFVSKLDSQGFAVLDHGPDVGSSLSLRGKTMGWLHGSERRTAQLR